MVLKENLTYNGDELSYNHNLAKDISKMSDQNYSNFRKIIALHQDKESRLQSLPKIKKIRQIMNKFFTISTNFYGWFNEPFEKIAYVVKNTKFPMPFIKDFVLKIHLSGDGLNLTRTRFNLVNFCFKILNETVPMGKSQYTFKRQIKFKKLKQNNIYTLGKH